MKTFRIHLMSMTRAEWIPDVVRFTGRDAAGSFGILANASRRMTVLSFGLARFQTTSGTEYLALPGGLLYFVANELQISTTSYVRSSGLQEISTALDVQLRKEEVELREIKQSLYRLDEQVLKLMYELPRNPAL
jgi:F-type H+-transporting ATPase subunit epsilon